MIKNVNVSSILKQAEKLDDRKLARSLRMGVLHSILKSSSDFSVLDHPGVPDRPEGRDISEKLYGVGLPKQEETDISVDKYNRSLSTRYSPDRVGVQARRIADGVVQDPITNKIYDWNEGFTTEDGQVFSGGSVALQSDPNSRS